MIHPNTLLYYIDIKNPDPKYKTPDQLWQEYCHKARTIFDVSDNPNKYSEDDPFSKIEQIDFEPSSIKITDTFGFTDLISIKKIGLFKPIKWLDLFTVDDLHAIISEDEYVPIFYNKTNIGFHGEVKYQYGLVKTNEIIEKGGFIRQRCFTNSGSEFSVPHMTNFNSDVTHAYVLLTKSQFFNACDVLLATTDVEGKYSNFIGFR